jgi:hypothetical protein
MGQALPEILAARRGTAALRPAAHLRASAAADQHIGLENRARGVTALVRIGCGTVTPAFVKESEILAPALLSPGVACIGHPAAESGVGEALRATARAQCSSGQK